MARRMAAVRRALWRQAERAPSETRGYCAGPSACAVDAPWMGQGQGQGPSTEWARRATWLHVREASGDGELHGVCNYQKPKAMALPRWLPCRVLQRERRVWDG
jgi:hypothetical protein